MNLDNLIDEIYKIKFTNVIELKKLLEKYSENDYKTYIKMSNKDYCRNTVYIDLEKNYEILILTWPPNCKSKIHNHPHNGCLLKVLQGSLIENIYNKDLKIIKTNYININDIGYMDDSIGLHEIINNSNEIAVSIHIYSPIYYKPKYFN